MIKCCKVIVTFIGNRPNRVPNMDKGGKRRFGNHFQDHKDAAGVISMLEEVYRLDCELDSGMPMDTILICNGGWPKEANEFIKKVDGSETLRGSFKVVGRDNIGISFGGYSHAFKMYRNRYKFWMFTEDDILYTKHNYALESRDAMRKNNWHFVAPIRLQDKHRKPHCYGGAGFTRRYVLDQVAEKFNGKLPYHNGSPRAKPDGTFKHHPFVRDGEVALTNTIVKLGMTLGAIPGLTSFHYDWKNK